MLFTLRSFKFRLFSNLFTFKADGNIRGNELHLEISSGASINRNVISLKEIPCLASAIKPLLLCSGFGSR